MLAVGTITYACMLLLLRGFGKRALAKMNAYDFITTIALGSSLSSTILSSDVTIGKALAAFILLLGLQRLVAVLSVRSRSMQMALNNEPTLLSRNGELLRAALHQEFLTEADLNAAVRAKGFDALSATSAIILETDGSISVIASPPPASVSS